MELLYQLSYNGILSFEENFDPILSLGDPFTMTYLCQDRSEKDDFYRLYLGSRANP